MTQTSYSIAPGVDMPAIGIGTWELQDEAILREVIDAGFAAGYRFIDTAQSYKNHAIIGNIFKDLLPKHKLTRKDIFITSKLSTHNQGKGKAYAACVETMKELGLDYLDLFLIHFPGSSGIDTSDPENARLRKESWADLETLKAEGKIRAIGVSNYMAPHLTEMKEYASIIPAVNQCEFHPHRYPAATLKVCKEMGIHFQAYSSMGTAYHKQDIFNDTRVTSLAEKHKCSIPQLLLAWALNQEISVLPKTTKADHVRSNWEAGNIKLSSEDIDALKKPDTEPGVYCWDPTRVK